MKTSHPSTFLTLIGIACCVWVSPDEPAIKAPLYQETKQANSAIAINITDNQLVKKDTLGSASLSIEEGGFRFAVW
jgi:hypothetical protein